MSNIIVPRRIPWSQKPQSPQVDWSNPINDGLSSWYLAYEGGGTIVRNLAIGNNLNLENGARWSVNPIGITLQFDGFDDQAATTELGSTDLSVSFAVIARFSSTMTGSGSNRGQIVGKGGAQANDAGFRIALDGGGIWYGLSDGTTRTTALQGNGFNDGLTHTIIVQFVPGGISTLYVDNIQIGTIDNSSEENASNNQPVGVGRYPGNTYEATQAFAGFIDNIRVINRNLSSNERWELTDFPFAGLQPRRIYIPVSAAAGATVSPDNVTHGHVADNATLSQNHILILANSSHGHTADHAALTQSHILAIADNLHSHAADNATLSQTHILAVADALHAHAADNVSLTVAGALDIANSIHAHSADQVALTQLHILATANALHGHSADNVTLISGLTLDITNAVHGHTASQVTLQQAHILAVINATHGHTAEQATLGVDLIIQPSSHAHTADIVSLNPSLALAIQDAIHAHQANNVTLTQQHILVISDALHNHIAQNVTLSEGALTIFTFPSRTITVIGQSRTIKV